MFEALAERYLEYEYPLAQAQLVLFMLGMGATLSVRDFAVVFRQPTALTYGVVWVLGITPFLAVGVAEVADVPTGVGLGLLLVGALSGGTLSNFMTYLARSNVALSIAMSGCGTLLSIATIPVALYALAGKYVPADFEMPMGAIIREFILCMFLPLMVGMAVARFARRAAIPVSKNAIRLGVLLVLVMVVGSLASGRVELDRYGWGVPITIIVFILLGQQLSMLPIRIAKWDERDFAAIGIEVTIRNIYLGLLIAALLFPKGTPAGELGGDVLFVMLFYGAASLITNLPLSLRVRRVIGRRMRAEGKS